MQELSTHLELSVGKVQLSQISRPDWQKSCRKLQESCRELHRSCRQVAQRPLIGPEYTPPQYSLPVHLHTLSPSSGCSAVDIHMKLGTCFQLQPFATSLQLWCNFRATCLQLNSVVNFHLSRTSSLSADRIVPSLSLSVTLCLSLSLTHTHIQLRPRLHRSPGSEHGGCDDSLAAGQKTRANTKGTATQAAKGHTTAPPQH